MNNLAYKSEYAEDELEYGFREKKWDELIDGKTVLMAPASINHNRIVRNIVVMLDRYINESGGGKCEVFTDGANVFLTEKNRFVPDVVVVCDPGKVKHDGIYGAPDLVVEVLSPSTAANDKNRKMKVYEKCGVREYWIVSSSEKIVEQYFLEDGILKLNYVYAVVPEFELRDISEEDKALLKTEFKCSLSDEAVFNVEEIFARVVNSEF